MDSHLRDGGNRLVNRPCLLHKEPGWAAGIPSSFVSPVSPALSVVFSLSSSKGCAVPAGSLAAGMGVVSTIEKAVYCVATELLCTHHLCLGCEPPHCSKYDGGFPTTHKSRRALGAQRKFALLSVTLCMLHLL